jgi:cysteine desulfurase / selenocysteine lyase
MAVDWQAVRAEFPSLARWTFLDTATFGQLPRRAVEAMVRHLEHRDELACADFLDWFDDADRIRGAIARLIGCAAEDVAFVTNAATALALLMGGLDWRPGDRIVTLRDEFPNNIYHPAVLEQRGVEVAEVAWEDFFEAVTPRTRLVVLSEVNYTSGFRAPVREISSFLRERGVLFYVDGTQSVGALRFDADAVRPDMLAVHGYKWLLSPNGAGFVYVAPELRQRLHPQVIGWRRHREWRRVDSLHHGAPEFKAAAEKYEGGMLPFPLIYAMGASVEMMLELGPGAIEERVLRLAGLLKDKIRGLGAELACDTSSQVVAARFPGREAPALARALRERGILVSARHGHLRVSTHFYNNDADLERLEAEIRGLGTGRVSP